MATETASNKTTGATVHFNVGGQFYEVSRSLLESFPDTMLTRIASETWQSDPNKTIFIDRDPVRFRYCLDFMRDACVDLPVTVPKSAFLRDLEYYGIEYDSTRVSSPYHPASTVVALKKDITNRNEILRQKTFENEHCVLAAQLFAEYSKNGSECIEFGEALRKLLPTIDCANNVDGKILDKYLAPFGLRFDRSDLNRYDANLRCSRNFLHLKMIDE